MGRAQTNITRIMRRWCKSLASRNRFRCRRWLIPKSRLTTSKTSFNEKLNRLLRRSRTSSPMTPKSSNLSKKTLPHSLVPTQGIRNKTARGMKRWKQCIIPRSKAVSLRRTLMRFCRRLATISTSLRITQTSWKTCGCNCWRFCASITPPNTAFLNTCTTLSTSRKSSKTPSSKRSSMRHQNGSTLILLLSNWRIIWIKFVRLSRIRSFCRTHTKTFKRRATSSTT